MFSSRFSFLLWFLFHISIALLFIFFGGRKVNTSLYSILPDTHPVKALSQVEEQIGSHLNSKVTILIGHESFEEAKEAAQELEHALTEQSSIDEIQLQVDTASIGRLQEYLHQSRYRFLSPRTVELLEQNKIELLAERAFLSLSSPVNMGALDYLSEDPFLLAQDNFQYFLESGVLGNTAMGLRDSYLSRDYQGKSWILLSLKTNQSGVSIELDENPVPLIYRESEKIQQSHSGVEFIFSGVPFHSYDSAESSQRQITLLSSFSSLFIIAMMLLLFRSIKPLAATSIAIVTGMACGLAVTLLVFTEIHIFTIVFGTSLIGISVDYSFHYFTEWAGSAKKKDVLKKIRPGITIGLVTTLLSYGAFTLTSFPLLQQMALFSISGLLSTYVSVFMLYPLFGNASILTQKKVSEMAILLQKGLSHIQKIRKPFPILLILLLGLFAILGLFKYQMDNDIRLFYKMSPQRQYGERMSAEILEHGSSGIYFLVEGNSLEENLQEEESIGSELEYYTEKGDLSSYLGLSIFLPSESKQDKSLELVENKLIPAMKNQLLLLGYGNEEYINNWDAFRRNRSEYTGINSLKTLPLNSFIDLLNVGEVDGRYYTTILLFGIENQENLKAMAERNPHIYYMNKSEDTSRTLQILSWQALKIILLSYLVIFLGLAWRYKWKRAAIIVFIPLMASLLTLTVITLMGLKINLFFVVGLILIPGMGTDYLILLMESEKTKPEVLLSITMSMLTTILAFGMLSFTSIASLFGLTVSIGVLSSYILSVLFLQWKRP